jgi:hypothetical protein
VFDFMLEHPLLVGGLAVPILVTVMAALGFAAEHGLPKDAVAGILGWNMGRFRPFTFILDRDGRVREFYFGARDYALFEGRVRRLMRGTGV